MEEIIESTTKNGPETESINATKSINSNTELLLEISVDNDEQKEGSQYYQHKTYSDESFKDELIFAASIVAEEAGDAGHDWKEDISERYLESGRNWLKTEGNVTQTISNSLLAILLNLKAEKANPSFDTFRGQILTKQME